MQIVLAKVKLLEVCPEHLKWLRRRNKEVFLYVGESRNDSQAIEVHFVLLVSERVLQKLEQDLFAILLKKLLSCLV